ncbi:response regulator transcription factor [Paenibacillus soyae]|uniref:Response regulator transcription factor n=1 Tax=Paenibacillus soyae TaxID=2969249 RepID=A0A9X2MT07_9BACL|nr:response regulator transcription factor [Paenibacillus soyae]MCR2806289.1 response regulator transcription factor [Paenibacillus soyae]
MWKIVIIDDDRNVLQGMKLAIPWKELGAEWAGEATDGEEGFELIRRVNPDLVITDIYMPVMSGLEMIELLRTDQFNGKIVILSGYSDFEHARQAMRLHVIDYLSKPVSVPTLKSVLQKVIDQLHLERLKSREQEELNEKLIQFQPFIEKEWVKSVVSGTLEPSYREDDKLPVPFESWKKANHLVIGVEMVRDIRLNAVSIADLNLFRFAVGNIVKEIANAIFDSYSYSELHGTRCAIVIHLDPPPPQEELRMKLRQLGADVIESVSRYLKINLRIGLGSLKNNWLQMSDSTEEAFRAIELRESPAMKGCELFQWDRTQASPDLSPLTRPVKFYQELISAVKAGQAGLANRIIADQFQLLAARGRFTPTEIQLLAGEMWGIMNYSLYEAGIVWDERSPEELPQQEIVWLTTLDMLERWVAKTVNAICSGREWKGNSKHRQAVDFMLQYLHDNYAEDVTLGELADKVHMSRNYLSDIFKNMVGDTFNNYLTRVRMEKAKELLLEKNMLVYEVANRVGYKNVPYFSTLFKKYIGINPTDLTKRT